MCFVFALHRAHVSLEHVPDFDFPTVWADRGSLEVHLVVRRLVHSSVELDSQFFKSFR